MSPQHVDPVEAVDIHLEIKSRKSIGIHWGTFKLSKEVIFILNSISNDILIDENYNIGNFIIINSYIIVINKFNNKLLFLQELQPLSQTTGFTCYLTLWKIAI